MRSASAPTVSSSAEAISAIRPNWEKETPASAMRSSMNWVARRAASRRFQPAHVSSADRASERSVFGACLCLVIIVCIYIECRYMESKRHEANPDRRQLPVALCPQGAGLPGGEGHGLRGRPPRAVLRRRPILQVE